MKHYLTPAEVHALYMDLAVPEEAVGGLRDAVVLDLACARPQLFAYGDAIADAAVLAESLVAGRPFTHLNEATAFAAMQATLELNGQSLACSATEALRGWDDWLTKPADWAALERWLRLVCEASA